MNPVFSAEQSQALLKRNWTRRGLVKTPKVPQTVHVYCISVHTYIHMPQRGLHISYNYSKAQVCTIWLHGTFGFKGSQDVGHGVLYEACRARYPGLLSVLVWATTILCWHELQSELLKGGYMGIIQPPLFRV